MDQQYYLEVQVPASSGTDCDILLLDCIDKRFSVVRPAAEWVKDFLGKRPYCLTKEGPVSKLSKRLELDDSYVRSMDFALKEAETTTIVIAAHQDCKGNQVSDEEQIAQLARSVERVREFGFEGRIITLFMYDLGYNRWRVVPNSDTDGQFA